jgi:hypothetical protein
MLCCKNAAVTVCCGPSFTLKRTVTELLALAGCTAIVIPTIA